MIELFLKNGAQVDANINGITPLWTYCSRQGDLEGVELFVKYGANINQVVCCRHTNREVTV